MTAQLVPCANCGAPMTPQQDGRTYACTYCNTRVLVAVDGGQIAAGLRLDLANLDGFLAQLANTLSAGYAEYTQIHANGRVVHGIEVNIEPDVFIARREPHGLIAQHKRLVRGIALRTETLALERWIELLTAALARHANTNARAAWVLAQLGGPHDPNHR